MRCKKDKTEMELKEIDEDGIMVKAFVCPICDLVIYGTDNPMVYRRMGMIE